MSLFVLSDTHLSVSLNKSMEVFGNRWTDYHEKIRDNWCRTVRERDTVVIPGDVSWGMSLEQAKEDLAFLNNLPGRKILGKGNHDYWWQTAAKLRAFCQANRFDSLSFLYNNAYLTEEGVVCGSRGWWPDEKLSPSDADYQKIVNREAQRLKLSLEAGKQLGDRLLVFLHFPPIFRQTPCREILDMLHAYEIKQVWYGHLHGAYELPPSFLYEDITFTITSADYLNFEPLPISVCR